MNDNHVSSSRALRWILSSGVGLLATTLLACSSGTSTGSSASDPNAPDASPTAPLSSEPSVGFWTAGPVNCGGVFDIAYGFAMCSTKRVSGVEAVASASTGEFKWLAEGSYGVDGDKVTLTLKRTVVEPSAIRGDVNNATLTLERQSDGTLVVVEASEMPECTGLVLKKTDTVTDADCEPVGAEENEDGCTADADCGSCKRCERSTGRCLTKLGC